MTMISIEKNDDVLFKLICRKCKVILPKKKENSENLELYKSIEIKSNTVITFWDREYLFYCLSCFHSIKEELEQIW